MNKQLLERLKVATSDYERTLIVMLSALERLPDSQREALWAVAIPHWFNGPILAALLEIPLSDAEKRYRELQRFPFVESFMSRAGHNIHEKSRNALLAHLWVNERDKYRALSAKATKYFSENQDPSFRIEAVYHRIISDPQNGATELQNLSAEWHNGFKYELLDALALTLGEHESAGRLQGEALAHTLFLLGSVQFYRNKLTDAQSNFERALIIYQEIGQRIGEANALNSLGDVQFGRDEINDAEESYNKALTIYQEIGERRGEANVLKSLSDVQLGRDKLVDAEESYNKALTIYQEIGERRGEANALRSLGDVQLRRDKLIEAEESYKNALTIYQEIGRRIGEANALRSLGDLQMRRDNLTEAEEKYKKALIIYQEIDEQLGEANSLKSLGDVQLGRDKLIEAEESYKNALTIYQKIGRRTGESNALRSLGDVQLRRDKLTEAEESYKNALTIYQEIGRRIGEANALRSLGDLQLVRDNLTEAGESYKNALTIYQKIGERLGEANALKSFGDLQLRRNELIKAEKTYKKALTIYQKIGERLGEANALKSLGDLQLLRDKVPEAEDSYKKALTIYQTIGDPHGVADTIRSLSNLNEKEIKSQPEAHVLTSKAPSVFISYAHADNESTNPKRRWLDRFVQFLRPLVPKEDLTLSSDQDIKIGQSWHQDIQAHLSGAKAVVLLVSPAFLASDYIRDIEMPAIFKNATQRGVPIFPILTSPSLFTMAKYKYPDPKTGPQEFTLSSIQSANPPSKTLLEMTEGEQNKFFLQCAQQLAHLLSEKAEKTP